MTKDTIPDALFCIAVPACCAILLASPWLVYGVCLLLGRA